MRSILFLIETIQSKQFGRNYLKNKNFFSIFSCFFEIYIKFWKISNKKMTVIADFFPKLRTPQNVVRYMPKKSHLKGPFEGQHGKRVKTLLWSEQQVLSPYLMIFLKVIESEKVCFSQTQNLITVC